MITGADRPPNGTRHNKFWPSSDHFSGRFFSCEMPSRFGPLCSGQSPSATFLWAIAVTLIKRIIGNFFNMAAYSLYRGSQYLIMTLLRISTLALLVISLSRADDLTDDLLAATRKGDLAQVKALLDKGASANSKTPYGQTPLFFACDRGYTEIAKLLVDRGAEVNVEDTFYHATPMSWAARKTHNDI